MLLTDEQINHCHAVDLVRLAEEKGFELKKVGVNAYKIDGFGGLYINGEKNCWNCFNAGKGGGPIQFLMFIEKVSWVKATDQLLQGQVALVPDITFARQKRQEEKEPFVLPEKNKTFKHVIAYLLHTRKLDKEIVYHFIQTEQLYENDKKSCVFVAYDEQKIPRSASYRSTGSYVMKGNVINSDKHFVFAKEGTGDQAFIFESPIDLMSYLTLLYQADKRCRLGNLPQHFISLEGLANIGLDHYLEEHPEIKKLTFCLDNDEWGQKGYERLSKRYEDHYRITRHHPEAPAKDFNEMLVNKSLAAEASRQEDSAEEQYEECL